MPARDTAPAGAPCWVNLMTSDPGRSRDFYTQLFGWTATEPQEDFGGYFNFAKDGVRVAGGMPSSPAWRRRRRGRSTWPPMTPKDAGGGRRAWWPDPLPAMPVADLGTMAMISDAGGAAIGLWQPGLHKGFGVFGEPGTPAWFELFTRDYAATVAFYRDVFGWDTQSVSDTPEFRYTLMVHGQDQLAGIMDASGFLPDGVPAHWSVYFGAADTDASLAAVTRLGRLGGQPRPGHPLRPPGRGGRPDRCPLQARRPERGHARARVLRRRPPA